ncbi:1,4-alpha-glucan branching protein domain-containing protein [Entomospira culicis]|uniref:DUF1957 domain-containing protein n=1 Tax=Entomospira culicis TaxID=2719989 RepID=A0A968GFU2_9SPIO|nr:1,4-alpha-glucan branching protein domain-containing protein [Entomospira culicis]NIZ19573.1 DUF1957 domain-containing protein [Entomospira culicis]NIZ69522.1 DUF1957 domain-containing protein [Entomospira culicis]WDI36635.1 DUF1957 domain-containing protein [Entomospira culicis]WDI38264.1 DUF1957 domain-containing protein [Entomospira culicis]
MKREKKGSMIFCFNAHLPFAKFSKSGEVFQERWFFEAMFESYLPMYEAFATLAREERPFFVLISISPTLMALLQDEDLQTKFIFYMHQKLNSATSLLESSDKRIEDNLARYYVENTKRMIALYRNLNGDLLQALKIAQEAGYCEVITSVGTSAFLPLYASYPKAVEAQIKVALKSYRAVFGRASLGIFLPYGGYYPGLDTILAENGVRYFVTAGQSLMQGDPMPSFGVFSPVRSSAGLVAFPRYSMVEAELWGEDGYARRGCYRNFYHEDALTEVVIKVNPTQYSASSLLNEDVVHLEGFKYSNNEGNSESCYHLEEALAQATCDAQSFLASRVEELSTFQQKRGQTGVILMVADLELLGHHWFEGTHFVREFFARTAKTPEIEFTLPSHCLQRTAHFEEVSLNFASWGSDGYAQVWLDQQNDWLIRHLFKTVEQMMDLAYRFPNESGIKRRVLDQAAREVLLLMAGDWPLLLAQHVNEGIALGQMKKHLMNFQAIYEAMSCNTVRAMWLMEMEMGCDIFKYKSFSYEIFRPKQV